MIFSTPARWLILLGVVGHVLAVRSAAAQTFDPILQFRSLATPHFTIHFHQGEDGDASRLARIAEDTWAAVDRALHAAPPHTHVLLVDQTDAANGWATPLPRNTLLVTAARPSGETYIGATDDWLRLVFTHEFTHIAHLDQSRRWARAVRMIFGRTPLAMPNTWLPGWMVEGLATFEESALSSQGRLHAGDFRGIIDADARAGRMPPLDRINGGLVTWPAGYAPYAYGLGFHAYLAQRFGEASLGQLAERTSGSLPYLWPRAVRKVYGQPLSALWSAYTRDVSERASGERTERAAAPGEADNTRLTHDGFVVSGPRFAPPICESCPSSVIYSTRNASQFPALWERPLAGNLPARRLAERYLGDTVGVSASLVLFDQSEFVRNAQLSSDLYLYDRSDRTVRRLSNGARLSDPDLSPDATRIVAVQSVAGRRDIVLMPISQFKADARVLVSEPNTQFNAPRWSPDGRSVVAARQRPGGYSEIVLIDVASRTVRVIAATPRTRWVTPTWRPDGRAVVAAADINEGPFNLYEITLDDGGTRPLTHDAGGAIWPDVSPDGRSLVYAGYTHDGFDVFVAPYRVATPVMAVTPAAANESPAVTRAATLAADTYRPWPTLFPTSWMPLLESSHGTLRLGAAVSGADVLERHAYSASATWVASQPPGLQRHHANRPDVAASYAYTRQMTQPWLAISRATSFYGAVPDDTGTARSATVLEHQLEAGLTRTQRRVRLTQAVSVSFLQTTVEITTMTDRASRNRSGVRAAWSARTARTYGYSVSPEGGVTVGVTAEMVRPAFGADGAATTWTADVRGYLPGARRHHVIALRAGGGLSRGDADSGRVFLLGGSDPTGSAASFSSEAFTLLRGFDANTFAGTRVVTTSAEYRWPLRRVERGYGTLPLFVRTLHAAVFADAGHAWLRDFSSRKAKLSVGLELSSDLVVGYWLPVTTTIGAAWGRDGSGHIASGWRVYGRLGRAF